MKQLYFTSSNPGDSTARVRAASAGITPDRIQQLQRHVGYRSPEGPCSQEPPKRLSLLSGHSTGRFLCHSCCSGKDPVTGTNGSYFSHVLLDVPDTLDTQQVILSWGSDLWQCTDQGGIGELPEALFLPVASELNDAELVRFLEQPANRELFHFVLTGLLATKPSSRIFLAAPARTVALCVYGLTRALPPALIDDFTFSTYESDPLSCPGRLVGTCWSESQTSDLPDPCYQGDKIGYNSFTGRKTTLTGDHPFVDFAVQTLASGQTAPLDEFHSTWLRLGIKDESLLELVFRLGRGTGTFTREESQQVLQHPTLCSWVVVRPEALDQLLEWALDDQSYATAHFARAVAALRQKPDILARLAQNVQDKGLAALRDNNLVRARNALEVMLPLAAPARVSAVWSDLIGSISDPDALEWSVRKYLLPKLARMRPLVTPKEVDANLSRWLRIPTDHLGSVLALDLPQTYRLAACLLCIAREGEPTQDLAKSLGEHPTLVLELLQLLPSQPEGEPKAVALFRGVAQQIPQHSWMDDVIRAGKSVSGSLTSRCIDASLDSGPGKANQLVGKHGLVLLDLLSGQPVLNRLSEELLALPIDNLRLDRNRSEFLQGLAGQNGLRSTVKERLDACLGLHAFLKQPALEAEPLKHVSRALSVQPPLFPDQVRENIAVAVSVALQATPGQSSQETLESVLLALGPNWPGGPTGLYRSLLHIFEQQRPFWKQNELLHTFLATALGAHVKQELTTQMAPLDAEAYGVAQNAATIGGTKVLDFLENKSESWPQAARSQWSFLSRAVQPSGLGWIFRDVGLVLLGALVGGGIVFLCFKMGLLGN